MPHPATPLPDQHLGEAAYDAYWQVMAPLKLAWTRLTMDERRAWQAAARAAIRDYLHRPPQGEEARAIMAARAEREAEQRAHDRAVAQQRREEDGTP